MELVFQNTGWTTPPKTKPLHEAHISTNGNVDNFDFLFLADAFRTPTTLFLSIGCTTVFNLSLATSLQHLGTRIVLECATRACFATCSKKHVRTVFVSFSPWNQPICSALATCEKNEKIFALQVILIWVCSRLLSYMLNFSAGFFPCSLYFQHFGIRCSSWFPSLTLGTLCFTIFANFSRVHG